LGRKTFEQICIHKGSPLSIFSLNSSGLLYDVPVGQPKALAFVVGSLQNDKDKDKK
jgi:hypothetical protein